MSKHKYLNEIKMEKSVKANYKKNYKEKNPEKYKLQRRNEKLKSKYGLSSDQYEKMLKDQDGKCKCCSERFKDTKTTHVDYCAESKTVRSLLCVNCNVALAYLKGNSEKAAHLLNYILSQKHNGS